MLQAIAILGGWLLMMGPLPLGIAVDYFRIEDQVPKNHLLRVIDRHVRFDFVREKLRASYCETGRPSIDPKSCCGSCCWGISTVSGVSGSCWKNCACTWRGPDP